MTLSELRGRLLKEAILKSMMTDELLQAFLNASDDDVDAAILRIKRYTLARKTFPGLFGQVDVAKNLLASGLATFMSAKTPSGESVIYVVSGNWDTKQASYEDVYACVVTILEHKALECSSGVYVVIDHKDFGLKHLAQVKPKPTSDTAELYCHILPVKVIKVINFNSGLAVRSAWKILAPFLSKQVTDSTVFLGKEMSTLHELVAPHALPDQCGGHCGPYDNSSYVAQLEADEQSLIDKWNQYQV
ncbi:Alpha-tocopherol transfer protein-like [Halotydeus destructor]|nr:Alpha-tocopherol transfer protein-like [Halotydeus destructor]